ncbi:MAG: pyruvate kinase [Dehalococcoidia bacterium]
MIRRRTKIVCTLGPASFDEDVIARMIRAGMDVARLNTSHGTLDEHVDAIRAVRRVARAEGKTVGVLLDLGGPKLRTGPLFGGRPLWLRTGKTVRITSDPAACTGDDDCFAINYPRLDEDILPGHRVLVDDGAIALEVIGPAVGGIACRVLNDGVVEENQGVAFPMSTLSLPALTDRDREAIARGVAEEADFFGLSFVRDADHVAEARQAIADEGGDIPIIAKIERRAAIDNLDAILAEADGAMVARGDLGVELPPEQVPLMQRRIIAAAARKLVPVITATQMLESMVDSPRPTRAEASDVANAVWDRSDALMLSQETAIGRYPVEAVAMMDRIIRSAESEPDPGQIIPADTTADDHSYLVALAARRVIEGDANVRAVVCFTRSGYTAVLLSKVRPAVPILGMSSSEAVCRRLSLARSVIPVPCPVVTNTDDMLARVDDLLQRHGYAERGDEVVVMGSLPVAAAGTTNFLKLHVVGETSAL